MNSQRGQMFSPFQITTTEVPAQCTNVESLKGNNKSPQGTVTIKSVTVIWAPQISGANDGNFWNLPGFITILTNLEILLAEHENVPMGETGYKHKEIHLEIRITLLIGVLALARSISALINTGPKFAWFAMAWFPLFFFPKAQRPIKLMKRNQKMLEGGERKHWRYASSTS